MDTIKHIERLLEQVLVKPSITGVTSPPETIFNSTVTKSSSVSVSVDTSSLSKLWVFCTNNTSTNLVITGYANSALNSNEDVELFTCTLDTTIKNAGYGITDLPPFIKIIIENKDTSNDSLVKIDVNKTQ